MTEFAAAVPARDSGPWFGEGLATRQAGDDLIGGASGAGSLLLNAKASQEAACSWAPAAIVPGQEPEPHDAGMSRFAENGSHPAEGDAAEGHARQVDGPGSSGNAENGSHPAAADFSNEPGAVLWRHTPPHRTESGRLSYGTASPDSSVQKTALWRTRAHLSAGAARGGGSSAGRHVERMTGASGSRWRIVVAQVRRKSMRARWLQSRCDTMSSPELCRPVRNVYPAARSLSLSPCAVNSNIGPAENIRRNHLVSGKK